MCLNRFVNTRDNDIEDFLRFKAIEFEKRCWCSTYLVLDAESIIKKKICIEGYFTLSNKAIVISSEVSKTRKKKLFKGVLSDDDCLPVILIGQLAKYIDDKKGFVGKTNFFELLDLACEIIDQINLLIPNRCILAECKKSSLEDSEEIVNKRNKLHQLYLDYGFIALQENDDYIQYVLMI